MDAYATAPDLDAKGFRSTLDEVESLDIIREYVSTDLTGYLRKKGVDKESLKIFDEKLDELQFQEGYMGYGDFMRDAVEGLEDEFNIKLFRHGRIDFQIEIPQEMSPRAAEAGATPEDSFTWFDVYDQNDGFYLMVTSGDHGEFACILPKSNLAILKQKLEGK